MEEADTPLSVQSRLFDRVTFCFPAGELFLGIPNPGINTSGGFAVVWAHVYQALKDATPPTHITSVTGRDLGQELLAHCRVDPICSNQQRTRRR